MEKNFRVALDHLNDVLACLIVFTQFMKQQCNSFGSADPVAMRLAPCNGRRAFPECRARDFRGQAYLCGLGEGVSAWLAGGLTGSPLSTRRASMRLRPLACCQLHGPSQWPGFGGGKQKQGTGRTCQQQLLSQLGFVLRVSVDEDASVRWHGQGKQLACVPGIEILLEVHVEKNLNVALRPGQLGRLQLRTQAVSRQVPAGLASPLPCDLPPLGVKDVGVYLLLESGPGHRVHQLGDRRGKWSSASRAQRAALAGQQC
eukprot:scaffold4189_cov378-Prasinococcus_capsulatus_cf.AAC.15